MFIFFISLSKGFVKCAIEFQILHDSSLRLFLMVYICIFNLLLLVNTEVYIIYCMC